MKEIILKKRYPHSREEDITDAFMRGYEIGKEQEHRWWSAFCANCKTEPNFKVDEIGDDDPTIHAIAYLQKVGWLQEHDRALTEPQTDCADTNLSEKPTDSTRSKMEQVDKTEPQTEIKVEPTWVGTTYGRFEDEPQTDCAWK